MLSAQCDMIFGTVPARQILVPDVSTAYARHSAESAYTVLHAVPPATAKKPSGEQSAVLKSAKYLSECPEDTLGVRTI